MKLVTKQDQTNRDIAYWDKILQSSFPSRTAKNTSLIVGDEARIVCDDCDKDVMIAVMFGEDRTYEGRMATVCWRCLEKAVALVTQEQV